MQRKNKSIQIMPGCKQTSKCQTKHILKKISLTSAEIEKIKRTAKETTNSKKQSPDDVRVKMENLTRNTLGPIHGHREQGQTH